MKVNWDKFHVADYRYLNYITTRDKESLLEYYGELVDRIRDLTFALPGVDLQVVVDGNPCYIRILGRVTTEHSYEDRIYVADRVELFRTREERRRLKAIKTKAPYLGRIDN